MCEHIYSARYFRKHISADELYKFFKKGNRHLPCVFDVDSNKVYLPLYNYMYSGIYGLWLDYFVPKY